MQCGSRVSVISCGKSPEFLVLPNKQMHARSRGSRRDAVVRLKNAPRKNPATLVAGRIDHKTGMHFCRLEVSGPVKNLLPEMVPVAVAPWRGNFYYPATIVPRRRDARRWRGLTVARALL